MKLWMDDVRKPEDTSNQKAQDFTWADNIWSAKLYLETGEVTFASLDHDLGPGYAGFENGYDLLCWMESNDIWPEDGVSVHSMNPSGRERMELVIRKHYGRNFW